MANFGVPGTGDAGAGTGGGVNTQCPPPPKSGLNKRPREPGGDIKREDAADQKRMKTAQCADPQCRIPGSCVQDPRIPQCRIPGSPPPSPSKRRVRFQHPSGILKHPKPPREHARSRESRRAGWRETPPGSSQIRDKDPDTDSVPPEHDGSLEEQRAARYAAELYATQTAQALHQAQRIAEELSYLMQQEAWGRRALEDRIVTGSKDLEQLRQAAGRYWTEAQDKLTTQTTKLAQLQEANESYAQQGRN